MQKYVGIVPKSLTGSAFLIERVSVQPALNRVSCGTRVEHLEPKAMQLLVFMAEHSGEVLSREVLLNAVWGDAFITDQVLSNAISQIRHAFGDEGKEFIQTIPKSGYLLKVHPLPLQNNGVDEILATAPAAPGTVISDHTPGAKTSDGEDPDDDADRNGRWRRWARFASIAAAAVAILSVAAYFSRIRKAISTPPTIHAVAVLPFENLSGDPEQKYLVDGVHEELISRLGRISALEVRSRTSAMHYRGTDKTVPQIARELKVDAVLEGSVRRSEKRVAITLQLIEAATDRQLWPKTYERELTDVLQTENEIAVEVAGEINATLTPIERSRFASARTVDPEAFEAYVKGRYYWYKASREGLDRALEYFQMALEKEPNYAPAYAGISQVWELRAHNGLIPSREGFTKARAAVAKALELDDALADAHEALADYLFVYEWDWAAAEKEYQRAIELNPNNANARCFYSFFLFAMRRPQEARKQAERAIELDPYNAFFHYGLAMPLLNQHRPDEALVSLQKALSLQPDSFFTHNLLWKVYEQKREYGKALEEAKQSYTLLGAPEVAEALEHGYASGGHQEALRQAADALVIRSKRTPVKPTDIAWMYAEVGEKERALDWLEKAYQERASMLVYLNVTSTADSLRDHPRFQSLLRRINFPQ